MSHFKRFLSVKDEKGLREAASLILGVTVRESRNPADPKGTLVIEGPDHARNAVNKLVERFNV